MDRIALVTGGAGNLGQAVCRALLERGTGIAVPFHHADAPTALDGIRADFPDHVHSFALDLTTERGAEQAVRQAVEWGGRLDVMVHLMGGYAGGARIAETQAEVWDRMMELNLRSSWLMARFSIPRMLEAGAGSLVFVSSRAALEGRAGHGAYAVAKAGILTLAGTIAEEYRQSGIRANAVLPGTIDTPANRASMPDADHSKWTSPAEIARVVAFLASAESSAINGAALPVYGRS